jgi:hypothetical protein
MKLVYYFIQILRNDCFAERRDVVYVRHLVWPRSVFEADGDCLHDAEIAVEQGERFYVYVLVADDADAFLVDLWGLLQVTAMHFVPRRGPLVHDAAEGTPEVPSVLDVDYRMEAVDANDVAVRVAGLAVHAGAVVQAHFAVELGERVDAAKADVAVERLGGHDGAGGAERFESLRLDVLHLLDERFSRDEVLYLVECLELRGVEVGVYDVRYQVDG